MPSNIPHHSALYHNIPLPPADGLAQYPHYPPSQFHHDLEADNSQGYLNSWSEYDMRNFLSHVRESSGPNHLGLVGPGELVGGAAPKETPVAEHPYECSWIDNAACCGQRFPTLDALLVHLGAAHDARGSADRRLVCQCAISRGETVMPCGADFRRDNLKRHIETHLAIKVACPDCHVIYSRSDTLKKHMKTHSTV
ncbi:hypothetical protein HYDPIDRAFT_110314 [Hydnomerulius pinastri MD-312]|nr:hypothetical protein HYDPIDRAFT_110314 [Hydnomerulius pinastri MD-312]